MGLEDIIGKSWQKVLQKEFDSEYMQKLSAWVSHTRQSKTIYPESPDVFRAFKLCPFGQVKVVILGQDPYHNGIADGLAFSYKDGQKQGDKIQSLDIIFKEIEEDVYNGFNVNYNYQLDYLARQGVLLLNTILTVNRGTPLSHSNIGWEYFTNQVILNLLIEASPKVFLLWGKEAQKSFKNVVDKYLYPKFMDNSIHLVLTAPHPAADLYKMNDFREVKEDYPNTFRGCRHFSKANEFLKLNILLGINWLDTEEPYMNQPCINETDDLPF